MATARTASSISPELHQEFSSKLEQLLDEHDDISEKRSRISKALGGELKIIARGIAHARRVLKGLDGPQEEIPGTEVGERRRDPGLEQILKAAGRVRDAAEKANEEAKGSKERPAMATLKWVSLGPGAFRATVAGGEYSITSELRGGWRATWDSFSGAKSKLLLSAGSEADARDACQRHSIEHQADEMLKGAGAGELARNDLKGPAEKFKKGGRRGS